MAKNLTHSLLFSESIKNTLENIQNKRVLYRFAHGDYDFRMTLKTRHFLIKIFFIFSIISIFLSAICFIEAFFFKGIIPVSDEIRFPHFLSKNPLTPFNSKALLISIMVLVLSVPAILYILLRFFKNIQSSEIFFFAGFLVSCLCEIMRLLTILFGLWQTFSNLLIFCGRIVLFGRILAPLSFISITLLSEPEQRQDLERNFSITVAVSTFFALLMPLNTAQILSTGMMSMGFFKTFNMLQTVLVLLAFISSIILSLKHENSVYLYMGISFLVLILGYYTLLAADNYLFLAIGTAAFFAGAIKFLLQLHKFYMWK